MSAAAAAIASWLCETVLITQVMAEFVSAANISLL
jgi:hypothetical protein